MYWANGVTSVGPVLVSAVADIEGFVHNDLTKAPANDFVGTSWATSADIDVRSVSFAHQIIR